MNQPRRAVVLRYMIDFRCLGPSCEDQCCSGWQVPVDQGHYGKLLKATSREPAEKQRFARAVALLPAPQRTRQAFASIQLEGDGRCPFLSEDRLCQIHARHGEAALPDACAMFPRTVSRVDGRLELSGALSCPEAARRALLAADAMEVVPVEPAALGRAVVQQEAQGADELDLLRGAMCGLLGLPAYPIDSLLFFTVVAAQQAHKAGTARGLAQVLTPEVLASVDRRLKSQLAELPPPLGLIAGVLGRRVQRSGNAFHQLVLQVMEGFAAETDGGVTLVGADPVELSLDLPRLTTAYQGRRGEVLQRHGARIAGYLRNYACAYWLREWPAAPGIPVHAQALLLRIALLRFLLLGHPAALLAARDADLAAGEAALDRIAVAACYTLSRLLEHNQPFASGLTELVAGRLGGPAAAVVLLAT